MTEEQIISELRTIRTLLAFERKQELGDIIDDLSEIQERILKEIESEGWSSIQTSEIANEYDVSKRTVQNHLGRLIDENLVEKQGEGRGTEYRKTGLLRAAELVTTN